MPRRVDQVELVPLPRDAHRLGLDRDPALALEIHRVEQLLAHVAVGDGVGELEDPVGERRLAVVDVRDDREVADAALVHGLSSRPVVAVSAGAEGRPPRRLGRGGSRPSRTRAGAAIPFLDGGDAGRVAGRADDVPRERSRTRGPSRDRPGLPRRSADPHRPNPARCRRSHPTPGVGDAGLDHPDGLLVDQDHVMLVGRPGGSARRPPRTFVRHATTVARDHAEATRVIGGDGGLDRSESDHARAT